MEGDKRMSRLLLPFIITLKVIRNAFYGRFYGSSSWGGMVTLADRGEGTMRGEEEEKFGPCV